MTQQKEESVSQLGIPGYHIPAVLLTQDLVDYRPGLVYLAKAEKPPCGAALQVELSPRYSCFLRSCRQGGDTFYIGQSGAFGIKETVGFVHVDVDDCHCHWSPFRGKRVGQLGDLGF
jgi:hypothetical protein